MRLPIVLIAATPLALLTACGESTPVEDVEAEPMEAALDDDPADSDEIASVDLSEYDYSGEYVLAGEDGETESITLDADDGSFTYTGSDGEARTGSFTLMEDNRRLLIEDFDGQAGYFSIDEGALYRLADENAAPMDRITVTAEYRRDPGNEAMPTGPGATVDNVADKRQ